MAPKRTTYTRPSTPYQTPASAFPLIPYQPLSHPPPQTPVRLPIRPALPPPPPGWTTTSHVLQAAYPRRWSGCTGSLTRDSRPFAMEGEGTGEDDRYARAVAEAKRLVFARYDAEEMAVPTVDDDQKLQKGLWMAAERWRRSGARDKEGGLTLVIMHGCGFTKESWRPTIHRLVSHGLISSTSSYGPTSHSPTPEGGSTWMINDIWFLEATHTGASMDLNAGLMGTLHDGMDPARDVLNFIEHVLPSSLETEEEEVLPWKGSDHGSVEGRGKGERKIIGVGHSVGGNAMVQAAHVRPDLFDALFLAEGMFTPLETPRADLDNTEYLWALVVQTCRRRDQWPSIRAASALRASPFFRNWHDESFSIFLSHHLVSHPDGGVKLATPAWSEALIYSDPIVLRRGWEKLCELELPVGFLMCGDSSTTYGDEYTRAMVWLPRNARNERIMSASHQIIQEAPDEVADAMWRYIGVAMGELEKGAAPIRSKL